jgi:hypothetical protein
MLNRLKALAMSPFGYYAPWEMHKNEDNKESLTKTISLNAMPQQPGQIKVQFFVNVSQSGGSSKAKDITAYVVPDEAMHVEYFLHFIHEQFVSNILGRLDEPNSKNGKLLFELLPKNLRGTGVTIWSKVFEELNVESQTKNKDLWFECIQRYLEEVAGERFQTWVDHFLRKMFTLSNVLLFC